MARHLRVEFPGAIYHVTCRMIGEGRLERSRLFTDDQDRERFVDRLAERVEQYHVRLFQFVLMTNHFHLVFETPEGNCSRFMQSLSTAYTVYYNLRHGRHGHVLDGRYKAKVVEGDEYLLTLTRYVHLNPVHVGEARDWPVEERIRFLRGYQWSTYPSYIGARKPLDFAAYGPVLAMMHGKKNRRPLRYRRFVEAALPEDNSPSRGEGGACDEFKAALKESPRCIGGEGFRSWVDDLYMQRKEGRRVKEDVAFRRRTEPLSGETILDVAAKGLGVERAALRQRRRCSPLRAVAARMLLCHGGQTQREAGLLLGMGTGGAVSAQVRRLPDLLAKDGALRKQVEEIEKSLKFLRLPASRQTKRGSAKC